MIKLVDLINEEKITDEKFEEFAVTRGKGAAKIASTAEEKGGLSLLTWHHFKVKAPYYKKAARSALVKRFALARGRQRVVALPFFIVPQGPVMLP